jgi:hypothetical protein
MIKPLQRIVGPYGKPIKIKALTPMIPRGESQYDTKGAFNGIVPFSPNMLKLEEHEESSYIIPKQEIQYLVEHNDMEDWKKLLGMFDGLLGNMMRLLNNIRRENYTKITYLKIEEQEIERRHNKLQEKLLDLTQKNDEIDAKTEMTDSEKIEKLKKILTEMGFVAGGAMATLITEDLTGLKTGNVHKRGASIAKMLMQRYGLTDVQAAAIVGNFIRESGLVPDNVENSSSYDAQEPLPPPYGAYPVGYGWAQWTGGRLNTFIEKFLGGGPNKRGKAANDGDNWKMLTYELDGPYNHVIQGLKSYTDITQATIYAEREYEGALIKANDERIAAAKGVLKEIREMKASGAIVLPSLFNEHKIIYDTFTKNTLLSNFIVDRPTIINMKDVGEPLVIIPTERPIGQNILKILFEKPFQKIEQTFTRLNSDKNEKEKFKNPENSQSQITRTTIKPTRSMVGSTSPSSITNSQTDNQQSSYTKQPETITKTDNITSTIEPPEQKIPEMIPVQSKINTQQTVIDNVSKSTSDIFEIPMILVQDYYVLEE